MVTPVQGGEGLEPLAIAFLVVFEEGPWVDVVGGGPEARLFIAMALSVLRGVPVPARQEASTVNMLSRLGHLCQEYLSTCSFISAYLSVDKRGSRSRSS